MLSAFTASQFASAGCHKQYLPASVVDDLVLKSVPLHQLSYDHSLKFVYGGELPVLIFAVEMGRVFLNLS